MESPGRLNASHVTRHAFVSGTIGEGDSGELIEPEGTASRGQKVG
jgi:hypothetical protein